MPPGFSSRKERKKGGGGKRRTSECSCERGKEGKGGGGSRPSLPTGPGEEEFLSPFIYRSMKALEKDPGSRETGPFSFSLLYLHRYVADEKRRILSPPPTLLSIDLER